jgi:perosamine synthetase
MGIYGAFSFHGTKTLTTGEGGMFVTNDADLFGKVLTLSNHGRSRGETRQFWASIVGFKYKMSNIQAAIGCAQMERIDALIERKRQILDNYRQKLSGIKGILLNPIYHNAEIGAWMSVAVFNKDLGITKELLLHEFSTNNIDARIFFSPLSGLPSFQSCPQNRHSWDIPKRSINLPSYNDMSDADQSRVVGIIKKLTTSGSGAVS